jgi:hypothetical protein
MVIQKLLVEEGMKRGLKASREYSVSVLGYDFIGLGMRLGIFLTVGVLIQAYFTATIAGGNWLNTVAGFFNIKFPSTLPEWLTKLFTTGWKGVAFWQIMQVIAILLVLIEYQQYERSLKEKGEKPNVTTQGAFLMIGLALSLMVFPQMIQKFKERQILSTPVNKGFGGEIL